MRDVAELELFFNEVGDPADLHRLAEEQVGQHRARIAEYETMVERFGDRPEAGPRMITVELGLEMETRRRGSGRRWPRATWKACAQPAAPATVAPGKNPPAA